MPPLYESQLEKLPPEARKRITEQDISECCSIRVRCTRENYESGNFRKYRLTGGGGEDELWLIDLPGAVKTADEIHDNYLRREKLL